MDKKRVLSIILILAMCMSAVPLSNISIFAEEVTIVDSGTCGENLTWKLDSSGTLTINGKGKMTDYASLSQFGEISPWAGNDRIKTIKIYSGVTSIGSTAFEGCENLINIEIPGSITSIGNFAFGECENLINIEIPEGVESIGDYAFYWCVNLTSIVIPDSVHSIGAWAFVQCNSLKNIQMSKNIRSFGELAFNFCSSLTNIEIPEGVTSIEHMLFGGCSSLTSIKIPESVTSIGSYAFSGCSGLTSIEIPNSVTSIGDSAFAGCNSLTGIEIPEGVTKIEDLTFSECNKLTHIKIPDSVTSIGEQAFRYCNLTSIEISKNITNIGYAAFANCDNLASIKIMNPECDIYDDNYGGRWTYIVPEDTIIYGYAGSTAQAYATKCGMVFIEIGKENSEDNERYVDEHTKYYFDTTSSYKKDIVNMRTTKGLGLMLSDTDSDLSDDLYGKLSWSLKTIDMIKSTLNISSYLDVKVDGGVKFSFKVPDNSINDLGSSEYSAILYQLMANDGIYQGILDTFSTNYQKNLNKFAKLLVDKTGDLIKETNSNDIQEIKNAVSQQFNIMVNADFNSIEFANAHKNYIELTNMHLDTTETKKYLKECSSTIGDVFNVVSAAWDEFDSIGKAYQYVCWAEAYTNTRNEFKEILNDVADKADERARELHNHNSSFDMITSPYSEMNMCRGLSRAIHSFLTTMDFNAKDAYGAFAKQVKDKTGTSCLKLTLDFLQKEGTDSLELSLFPELEVINKALSSGKLLLDLGTTIDDEYKMALSVKSLDIITKFLINLSKKYGDSLLIGTTDIQYIQALKFNESINMYKNAMLLACDYAIEYERLKLTNIVEQNSMFPPNLVYDIMTPIVSKKDQEQASLASTAISMLTLQKAEINSIHCHKSNLSDEPEVVQHIKYSGSFKVITVACPVNVTVISPTGNRLAKLTDDFSEVNTGYEHYFFTLPIDDKETERIKIAIIPNDINYQVLIDGIDDGTMDVFIGEYDGNQIISMEAFINFAVTNKTNGYLDFSHEDNTLGKLVLNGMVYGDSESTENTGIYMDSSGTTLAANAERTIYVNGGNVKQIDNTKINFKTKTYYTKLQASDIVTMDKKGKMKTKKGKLVVGITDSKDVPTLTKGKFPKNASITKIAKASISKGKIKVTANGQSGEVYLWVMDTGDTKSVAYAKIYVKAAPSTVQLFAQSCNAPDFSSDKKNVYKKDTIELGNSIKLYVYPTYKLNRTKTETKDATYSISVDKKVSDCFEVAQDVDDPHCFIVTASAIKNNKITKGKVTIKCDQNGKKAVFTATAANSVQGISVDSVSGLKAKNADLSDPAMVIQTSETAKQTGSFTLTTINSNNEIPTTDKPKIYMMGSATGFNITKMVKGKVEITSKLSGDQKKLSIKLGGDRKTVTVTAAKKTPAEIDVYCLVVYNMMENKGYKVIKITTTDNTNQTTQENAA